MSLRDLFRPAWKASDPVRRRKAVEMVSDQAQLEWIARHDPAVSIREHVVGRLSSPSALADVARLDSSELVRRMAIARVSDPSVLFDLANHDPGQLVQDAAVLRLREILPTWDWIKWLVDSGRVSDAIHWLEIYEQGSGRPGAPSVPRDRAIELLLRIRQSHIKDSYIRVDAAIALGKFGDPRGAEYLIDDLGGERFYTRSSEAIRVLAAFGSRVIGPLLAMLGDQSPNVRCDTARALGAVGDARAILPLIRALGDIGHHHHGNDVRTEAAEALAALGEPQWRAMIKGSGPGVDHSRDDFTHLAKSDDPRTIEPLLNVLVNGRHEGGHLGDYLGDQVLAAMALGERGDKRAIPYLRKAAADRGAYPVRHASIGALIELGETVDHVACVVINISRGESARHDPANLTFGLGTHLIDPSVLGIPPTARLVATWSKARNYFKGNDNTGVHVQRTDNDSAIKMFVSDPLTKPCASMQILVFAEYEAR